MLTLTQKAIPEEFQGERPNSRDKWLHGLFFITILSSFLCLIEPAPYDFLILILFPFLLLSHCNLHRRLIPIFFVFAVLLFAGFLTTFLTWGNIHDYTNQRNDKMYQIITLYVYGTFVFFSLFFSQYSFYRYHLCMKTYVYAALICAIIGILGYLHIGPFDEFTLIYGSRVKSTFKDTNVFSPFLIPPILYLLQGLLLDYFKKTAFPCFALAILSIGTTLSFSRGAWLATAIATSILVINIYFTEKTVQSKKRILRTLITIALVGSLLIIFALTDEATRDMFLTRTKVVQDYDVGEGGRFGGQLQSLSVLLDSPFGLGPFRYFNLFKVDPHNSYISAFANAGWVGGFTFILVMLSTLWISARQCFTASPFQRIAQVCFPLALTLTLQAIQIDIDHWRHMYLIFGIIWGLEVARARWLASQNLTSLPIAT